MASGGFKKFFSSSSQSQSKEKGKRQIEINEVDSNMYLESGGQNDNIEEVEYCYPSPTSKPKAEVNKSKDGKQGQISRFAIPSSFNVLFNYSDENNLRGMARMICLKNLSF